VKIQITPWQGVIFFTNSVLQNPRQRLLS
jgi:hypothetical protein